MKINCVLAVCLCVLLQAPLSYAEDDLLASTQTQMILNPVDCLVAWYAYAQCVLKHSIYGRQACVDLLETAQQCDWTIRFMESRADELP